MRKKNETSGQPGWIGSCLAWFLGGGTLGFMAICSLALLALFVISTFLNAYLGWELLGFEVSVNRPIPGSAEGAIPAPTSGLAAIAPDISELEVSPATPISTESPLETQHSTLVAMATNASEAEATSTPTSISAASPLEIPHRTPVAIATPASESELSGSPISESAERPGETEVGGRTGQATPPAEEAGAIGAPMPGAAESTPGTPAVALAPTPTATSLSAPTSTNTYELIPLEGERDKRPAPKHADLSLKLREPQPVEAELSLVTVEGGGSNEPPQLSGIVPPNFVATYTLHDWDWSCDCKKGLIDNPWGNVAIVEIATTPGQPVFIPRRRSDIFQGKYYAVVLYATQDSLTFVYSREGTVANAYSVHYEGLQVDPNLLAQYRESEGNQLPGLTLDTPVGITTDKLKVAIRDRGTFMDPRSKGDWWN